MDGTTQLIVVFVVLLALALLLGLPGKIARDRNHPNATAIQWCGISGILFPPLWLVAIIWAFSGASGATKRPSGYVGAKVVPSMDAPTRAFPVAGAGRGKYKISGVDRNSGMDTTWHCDAESAANAHAKGQLQGIIVTDVQFVGPR